MRRSHRNRGYLALVAPISVCRRFTGPFPTSKHKTLVHHLTWVFWTIWAVIGNDNCIFQPPRPYHSNNPSYEYDSQSRPGPLAPSALHPVDAAPAAYLATSPLPMQETFPTSPPPSGLAMHGQQSTYYPPHDPAPGPGISKRPRSDHTEDARGDDHDDDSGNNDSKESKAKP